MRARTWRGKRRARHAGKARHCTSPILERGHSTAHSSHFRARTHSSHSRARARHGTARRSFPILGRAHGAARQMCCILLKRGQGTARHFSQSRTRARQFAPFANAGTARHGTANVSHVLNAGTARHGMPHVSHSRNENQIAKFATVPLGK